MYSVCEGTPVNLSATGDGTYAWTPATYLSNASISNPVASPSDSIQYKVVLTNSYGCKDSAMININVFKKAFVSAGTDKTILAGDTVLLDGLVKGTAVNYAWASGGNVAVDQIIQPQVSPIAETNYTLSASSTLGCGNSSSTITVHVYKDAFMASAFSPNADGLNDVYHVFKLDSYQLISFAIFNRFGRKVFSTVSATDGWDGTFRGEPQATGYYIYYLEMKHVSGRKIKRKGSMLLLR
jgi:gliding motility-associated-like protein